MVFYDKDDILKFIECSLDYYIRIWDFHSGKLISKINISISKYCKANILCVSNSNCLFVGTCGGEIIKIDLKTQKIIYYLKDQYEVFGIKIFDHPKYDECLITKGFSGFQIKLWTKNKKNL
jgi:WD40 repeat protein